MELNTNKNKEASNKSRSFEALMRLKSTEKHKTSGMAVKRFELSVDSDNHLVELKATYENTAENVLSKLDSLERKMSSGDNYLSFYNEKRALEDQLLKILDSIEKDGSKVPVSLLKRLQSKRDLIEKTRKNFK